MAGIITLEDGSDLYASNMGLGGALECIAEAISGTDPCLANWLADVAKRPGGFMDFDLRGLSTDSRRAFWAGVEAANLRFTGWDQVGNFSVTVGVIRLFHEKREARAEIEETQVTQIDLHDIWFADEASVSDSQA